MRLLGEGASRGAAALPYRTLQPRGVQALIRDADPDVVEEWKWRGVPVVGARRNHLHGRDVAPASRFAQCGLRTGLLLPVPRRKFLLDILPPIQHANDFRCVIDDTI